MSTADIVDGDVAWVLTSSALVLLMTPGLAFFYGGMARAKNMLNILAMSIVCMGLVSIVWVIIGYSLAFGPGGWFIGDATYAGLDGVGADPDPVYAATIPALCFSMFQLMFAIITPALISGAAVERMKFSRWIVFVLCWLLIVYCPVAHWVWSAWENEDGSISYGWLREDGALDFAGGTVVHIISGISGLVTAAIIGPRKGFPGAKLKAHNIPFTILGAALLWFGWFGFNGGSSLAANSVGVYAAMNTQLSAASAMFSWLLIEFVVSKPSMAGAATGAVVGLVVITPAAGFVFPWAAIVMGIIGTMFCFAALFMKHKYLQSAYKTAMESGQRPKKRFPFCISWIDDSLDAFGCHGLGGIVGAVLTGFFANKTVNPAGNDGVFYGNAGLLPKQLLAVVATLAWAAVCTTIILLAMKYTIGLRVDEEEEEAGLDISEHDEEAYNGLFKSTGIEQLMKRGFSSADLKSFLDEAANDDANDSRMGSRMGDNIMKEKLEMDEIMNEISKGNAKPEDDAHNIQVDSEDA
jgi:Amt family ammonium transporter